MRAAELSPTPSPINVTRPAQEWLANADLFLARDERRLVLEIPMGFTEMQREAPALALEWRMQTRELFEAYFARGYRVVDFFLDRGARPRALPAGEARGLRRNKRRRRPV